MSLVKRLLGLDRATGYGTLSVSVRYLDQSDTDGDAAGLGFLHVGPEGLVWKLDGYGPGNRGWVDVTSWAASTESAETARLHLRFEGRMRVKRDVAHVRITVDLASSPREVAKLTARAREHLAPELIVVPD